VKEKPTNKTVKKMQSLFIKHLRRLEAREWLSSRDIRPHFLLTFEPGGGLKAAGREQWRQAPTRSFHRLRLRLFQLSKTHNLRLANCAVSDGIEPGLEPRRKNRPATEAMKTIQTTFKFLTALALAVLAAGCAGSLLDKENAAVAADFKVITPNTPEQQALLRKLPADKVTRIIHDGRPYYVLPDLKNNQAYVGGPKQFQTYQQFRQTQKLNSENLEATPDADQTAAIKAMNWSGWSGWGAANLMDRPGWY